MFFLFYFLIALCVDVQDNIFNEMQTELPTQQ
jgi:hypothetical protein